MLLQAIQILTLFFFFFVFFIYARPKILLKLSNTKKINVKTNCQFKKLHIGTIHKLIKRVHAPSILTVSANYLVNSNTFLKVTQKVYFFLKFVSFKIHLFIIYFSPATYQICFNFYLYN